MITRLMQLDIDPAFQQDLEQVRWIRSLPGVNRYSMWMLVIIGVCVAIFTAGMGYTFYEDYNPDLDGPFPYALPLFFAATSLLALTAYTTWMADLTTLMFGVGSIRNEIEAERIDLLRVSSSEENIVNWKYTLVMARAWRFMAFFVALRLFSVLLFIASGFAALTYPNLWTELGIPPEILREVPVFLVIWAVVSLVMAAYIVVEPIFKMRLYASLSLYISTRVAGRVAGILLSLVGVFVIQTMVSMLFGLVYLPFSIGIGFSSYFIEENPDLLPILLRIAGYAVFPLIFIGGSVGILFLYHVISRFLLRDTISHLTNKL